MTRQISGKKLGALTVAAGAAALGTAGSVEAGLQVFDHRAAPFYPIVDYWTWDQTLLLMNVKTGDFQYVVDDLGGTPTSIERYDQNGFVDNNPIPESAKTNDTVWFSHRDVTPPGKSGAADVVALETMSGGVAGTTDIDGGTVYVPGREPGSPPSSWIPHDWYWADQLWDHDDDPGTPDEVAALPLPADTAVGEPLPNTQIDSSLTYTDGSSTGYTGAVSHGFGGLGHGSGSAFGYRWFSIGFKIEEADGTHYGWVALDPGIDLDRNRIRSVFGWAYNTTPDQPALLKWESDPVSGLDGDFDGDGDVDADDVDDLCANMGGDVGTYDMDGDGDVDEDDMTFHVENYLEYDSDGDGTPDGQGTFRGDFNADGSVNGTDLSIMNGNFGGSVGFAGGNANCDATVNGTDLSILAGVFGNVATSQVPEPMTITLLSLGGVAALKRRTR